MKKFIIVSSVIGILTSCTPSETLSPEEVLHRSILANQQVASLNVQGEIEMKIQEPAGSKTQAFQFDGVIQDGGKTVEMSVSVDTDSPQYTWKAHADLRMIDPRNMYILIHTLQWGDAQGVLPELFSPLLETWWRLPSAQSQMEGVAITPDPRLLQMQASVVDVVENLGMDSIGGMPTYHYRVSLDKDRLATLMTEIGVVNSKERALKTVNGIDASGEIWIDRETYLLHRIEWHIKPTSTQSNEVRFTLELSDTGAESFIQPPEASRELPVSLDVLLSPHMMIPTTEPTE